MLATIPVVSTNNTTTKLAVAEISSLPSSGEQDDGSLGIPVDNPYDGVTPSPSDEKIIDWTTTSSISWDDAFPEYPTGCIWACFRESCPAVQPASGEQVQDITIPLFRDFSRVQNIHRKHCPL